jgi:hypothetical protein
MATIPVTLVGDNQFQKARRLMSPVVVVDSCTFRIPSDSLNGERDHKVQLDDPERPHALSCTCEAGTRGLACWGMARVLDALGTLRAANVYVSKGAASSLEALAAQASAFAPAEASFGADGDFELRWGGHPKTGEVYVVP